MESKTVKIVIIVAVIIGIIAIIGITALVVHTTKSTEPRVLDLNDENQIEEIEEDGDEEISNLEQTTENEESNREESGVTDNLDNTTESIEETAAATFNQMLLPYEGENVSGQNVNTLLEKIRNSNEQNEEHPIKALANVQNWDSENNRADTESNYKVSMEKDEESGYINIVKIQDAE